MSGELQNEHSHHCITENEIWRLRWFLVRLNAIALLLSIPASVVIAVLTKSPLPGLIPAPLVAPLILIIRWAFSNPSVEKQKHSSDSNAKRVRAKTKVLSDALLPPS